MEKHELSKIDFEIIEDAFKSTQRGKLSCPDTYFEGIKHHWSKGIPVAITCQRCLCDRFPISMES